MVLVEHPRQVLEECLQRGEVLWGKEGYVVTVPNESRLVALCGVVEANLELVLGDELGLAVGPGLVSPVAAKANQVVEARDDLVDLLAGHQRSRALVIPGTGHDLYADTLVAVLGV